MTDDLYAGWLSEVLAGYDFAEGDYTITPLGNGLINRTWLVQYKLSSYVLQRVNSNVFTDPKALDQNLSMIGNWLAKNNPAYKLHLPIPNTAGLTLVSVADGHYRLMPFAAGSHTIDVVAKPEQAYEAANAFAGFTSALSQFDATQLHETIPGFHNLSWRYRQLTGCITNAIAIRKKVAADWIANAEANADIVDTYYKLSSAGLLPTRVMHHDTKISNVLFNAGGQQMGVIDLDTVMPGLFISDVGDMMRTYLSPVSEEEQDFGKIEVREDIFAAIVAGYTGSMGNQLIALERGLWFYAATFMVYMQAIRFLGDYLAGDTYYGARYENHNLVRAGNQFTLLQRLLEKEEILKRHGANA